MNTKRKTPIYLILTISLILTSLFSSTILADNSLAEPKLVAIYNSAHGADIRFKEVKGATSYNIHRKYNGKWSLVTTVALDDLDYENNCLKYIDKSIRDKYGEGYIYSVSANKGKTTSSYNKVGLALYRLKQPTITTLNVLSKTSVRISWKLENAQSYELQYSTNNGKTWTKLPQTSKDYIIVRDLIPNQRYYFRLRTAKTNKDRGTTWSAYSKWIGNYQFTGIINENNKSYYYENGSINKEYNDLYHNINDDKWYYVSNGEVDKAFVGVIKYETNGKYYFIKNGTIDRSFTGISKGKDNNTYYYVEKGVVNTKYSGTVHTKNGNQYQVSNGIAKATSIVDNKSTYSPLDIDYNTNSTMKGIDISDYQKDIDLNKVECDFVIIKATEGWDFKDKSLDTFPESSPICQNSSPFFPSINAPIISAYDSFNAPVSP